MALEKWLSEKRLTKHITSKQEIQSLLDVVERDIQDAQIEALSNDRRFMTAYNAALQIATCVLFLTGFRTGKSRGGHHWITFAVLPEILGDDIAEYADYFDTCRLKRNHSDYTSAGAVSLGEAEELIDEVIKFEELIRNWINEKYSEFL